MNNEIKLTNYTTLCNNAKCNNTKRYDITNIYSNMPVEKRIEIK